MTEAMNGGGSPHINPLFDLAPDGVCPAILFTEIPGGLLHHLFTLILLESRTVYFLWHFPFPSL